MHTTERIKRAKKPIARPVITAPKMLVAAKAIPRRIIEVKIVPSTPVRKVATDLHMQEFSVPPEIAARPKTIAR